MPAVTTPNLETGVSNKSSTAPWPESKPDDHADFINSFLSSDEDFSTPFTAATSSLIAAAREKSKNETTEYDSFHAEFSSFLSETANYGPSLSQDGDIIDPSSDDTTEQVIISQDNKTADFSTPNIKPVKEAPQEKASNKFEKGLEEKVSSTQNILSVCTVKLLLRIIISRGIFAYVFCPISARLSFSNQSAKNKVLNVKSALRNELSLEIRMQYTR